MTRGYENIIDAKFEKQVRHLGIAFVSRTHQRSVAVVVLDVHRNIFCVQKFLNDDSMTPVGSAHQGHIPVLVGLVHVDLLVGEQQVDHLLSTLL